MAIAAAVLVLAGASGAVVTQSGGSRTGTDLSEGGTASLPSESTITAGPSSSGPTTTAPFLPIAEEPWVPATPSPPPATPILASNGSSDPVYYRLHISAPVVFVTIDDGWVRDPRVIDFLHQSGWPISIFLIERAASEGIPYFSQLQGAGATIEDHTFDHPFLSSLSADRQTSEICKPAHDFPGMFGHTPTLIRPPYGAWNAATPRAARACGLSAVVEWSATFYNGRLAIAAGTHLRPGDVILLHFDAPLYGDLVQLRQILASQGLAVGRLESYISNALPAGQATTTTSAPVPTTTVSTSTTVQTTSTTRPVVTTTSSSTTSTTAP